MVPDLEREECVCVRMIYRDAEGKFRPCAPGTSGGFERNGCFLCVVERIATEWGDIYCTTWASGIVRDMNDGWECVLQV